MVAPAAIDDEAAGRFAASYADRPPRPLAIVIAAYDEEDGIGDVIRTAPASVAGLATELIVVDDGSADATAARAAAAGALVSQPGVNRGQGAALRLGYRLARERGAQVIATLDADGQYDPADLEAVCGPIVAGTADFVSGSRTLGVANTTDKVRGAGVVLFGRVISLLSGHTVTDPANGLRAMRADVSGVVRLEQPQYQAAELLLSVILAGYRVAEVPTTMNPRSAGTTKKGGNLRYGYRFGKVILRTWLRDRRGRGRSGSGRSGSGRSGSGPGRARAGRDRRR
jgi:glycosyltransferase involved in cell wall biosynthesis